MKYWKEVSRVIQSNLFCQKHGPDKMAQHPVYQDLKSVPL